MQSNRTLYRIVYTKLDDDFVLRACEVMPDGRYGPQRKITFMVPDMSDGVIVLEPPSVSIVGDFKKHGILTVERNAVIDLIVGLEKELPALYPSNGNHLNAFLLLAPTLVSSLNWEAGKSRKLPIQFFHVEVK